MSGQPFFLANRTKSRAVLTRFVDEHYATLPEAPRIEDFTKWFEVIQWNARATLYEHFVVLIREQCALRNETCTIVQAREHLAEYVEKSVRTVERYMQKQPLPKVRSENGNGNGNGRGGRGN